ncbi:MAG: hypothetical protein HFF84_03010 [Oscillibacter sp.]|nr:hypothetical protein [Oscillibacter sp.]
MEETIKSIQRGDTTIMFATSAEASLGNSGLSGSGASEEAFPGEAAARPWYGKISPAPEAAPPW